ncbi:glyoxalase/bleomycin resistance/extradiol dioxygenase family protein [Nitratireductor sp. XY-223]|uniref:VOC family protein n=1 Tax=Nitratireductor sp. XY-223 TaxID=2561926 RepID=UPI00145BFEB0|nr:glyoxalase/bleomycin resistance/extradiol dioxygenase family protein [Nitratireductor sp. XY-223]
MTPTPYLFFNGQCAEAIAAYAEIFGGEIMEQMPASGMPAEFQVPEERQGWIMHSRVRIGDGDLMASDNIMGESAGMEGSSVMLSFPTADEGKTVFDRLAEGGEIQMAWAPTFWAAGFGTLTDRFGVKWMIGCDEPPQG